MSDACKNLATLSFFSVWLYLLLSQEIMPGDHDQASQVVLVVKNPPARAGNIKDTGSIPGLGRSPGEGLDNPLQYSGESQGQRSLAGCSPWGCKESDV